MLDCSNHFRRTWRSWTSASAENKDAVVVSTRETADRYNLESIGDLAPVAGELAIGAAPEFETRQQGLVGLKDVYGVEFRQFVPTDTGGPITIAALGIGTVQAANIYTTDPSLSTKPFVALSDPKALFGAQNVSRRSCTAPTCPMRPSPP